MNQPTASTERLTERDVLNSARKFIYAWISTNSDASTGQLAGNGDIQLANQLELHQAFPTIFLDYKDALQLANIQVAIENDGREKDEKIPAIKGVDERQLKYAVEEFTLNLATERRQLAMSELRFDAGVEMEGAEQLASWISALLGRDCEAHELGLMQHWLHCVKRKMRGLPTEWQMFVIFYSMKHGPGKSRAVEHLLAPLMQSLVFSADEHSLKDERRFAQFQKYSVGYFDEMQGVDKVSNETIKRIITSPTVSMRPLYGNDVKQVKQRCMFIGTSNKPVNILINDTGMRRFWEFLVTPVVDHAKVNAMDPLVVWKSINEDLDDASYYIRAHLSKIQSVQNEELATEDPVIQFLDRCGFDIESDKKTVEIRATDVYDKFSLWCEENGYSKMSSGTFGKRVRQFRVHARRDKNGMLYLFNQGFNLKGSRNGGI